MQFLTPQKLEPTVNESNKHPPSEINPFYSGVTFISPDFRIDEMQFLLPDELDIAANDLTSVDVAKHCAGLPKPEQTGVSVQPPTGRRSAMTKSCEYLGD